jgi:N4-gp56 family major capsid protein
METAFATGDALTKKVWSEKTIRESVKDIFFAKFMGKGGYMGQRENGPDLNAVVVVKEELTKTNGDAITIPLRMRLTNDAVDTENANLEGNEEEMVFHDFTVTIQEKGNAVKAKNKMALKRPAFDLRTEFKDGLKDWLSEYIDIQSVLALSTSPTSGETIYGGDATSTATIESADVMSTTVISKGNRKARLHTPKVNPVMSKGKPHYILLEHDYQHKSLRAESTWYQAQQYANVRGEDNPMFSGAAGMWDGVVCHEYERIRTYSDWGSTSDLNGARALLLGAQALVHAWGQRPAWYEKLFDYNRVPGVATDLIWKASKAVFNSKDFGVITIDTSYAGD